MAFQRTLRQAVQAVGVGLHSGVRARLRILPAEPDTGIVFRRTDLPDPRPIPARIEYVCDGTLATTLEREGQRVGTVEHLLAALAGLGIDNALVELDGPEVPILDGSAAPFVFLLRAAGMRELAAPRPCLELILPVEVVEDGRRARLEPCPDFEVSFTIDFDHPLGRGDCARASVTVDPESFAAEIARARTFGFARDVEALRACGLILGGSLDNAILLGERTVLNPEGLRRPDELVRHKILDAIGDLALLGALLRARYIGDRAGHRLNHRLLRSLLARPEAFRWVVPAGGTGLQAAGDPGRLARSGVF
jgi:UDP-3-O-[3-hydroxymyristoyl] N-acetylglucosamine deacetylase